MSALPLIRLWELALLSTAIMHVGSSAASCNIKNDKHLADTLQGTLHVTISAGSALMAEAIVSQPTSLQLYSPCTSIAQPLLQVTLLSVTCGSSIPFAYAPGKHQAKASTCHHGQATPMVQRYRTSIPHTARTFCRQPVTKPCTTAICTRCTTKLLPSGSAAVQGLADRLQPQMQLPRLPSIQTKLSCQQRCLARH